MSNYTVYGIPNCDTVKKALTWLKAHDIPFVFHDYKKGGIAADEIAAWCLQRDWEILLNKKGTTWRALDDATKATISNEAEAIQVMAAKPSLIKRPVIVKDGAVVLVGFNENEYTHVFV